MRTVGRASALVVLVAALAGCGGTLARPAPGAAGAPGPQEAAELYRSELFFGLSKPDGSLVSDGEWRAFLAEHVTPRFPAGLTVLDGSGQWREQSGRIVREPSKIVLLLHPATERTLAAIEEIRAIYKRLFDQESVLLIRSRTRVSF